MENRSLQIADFDEEPFVRTLPDGRSHIDLVVSGLRCGGCIARVEGALKANAAVSSARVNLSTGRVGVDWDACQAGARDIVSIVEGLGYEARPFDAAAHAGRSDDAEGRLLLRALAVAGFAAGNVMLLSVSVWAGADAATRDLFHWLSALIALPAVAYAGRPFFASAFSALGAGRLNMDVPISLAVVLAAAMSLYETIGHGEQTYFDASITLLFFLLSGRVLDHMMRARARSAVTRLLALSASSALVVTDDGETRTVPIDRIGPGTIVLVAAGERVPVDGTVTDGASDIDRSLVTGESLPERLLPGGQVLAGTLNLSAPVRVRVTATGEDTFLADVIRLMEAAESGKARYMRLADRAARIYAPAVHIAAALTFVGWMLWTGGDWRVSALTAIAVLIITCPCALGLAVPAVQVVANGVLFQRGVMVKDATALERLAEVDTVVFDKTGTLTMGQPRMVAPEKVDVQALALAAGLARESRHPLSRALVDTVQDLGIKPADVGSIVEHPGYGLEGRVRGKTVRLGSADWCGATLSDDASGCIDGDVDDAQIALCLEAGDGTVTVFRFEDQLKVDARETVSDLAARGLGVEILSGDRRAVVAATAHDLGIECFVASANPQGKVDHLEGLRAEGKRVAMIGDGINDAPALAAGYASMAPGGASDVGRAAADFVFLGDRLQSVALAVSVAKSARRLIMQNFGLAVAYNLIAVPVAVLGFASPLVAAIAMSVSSLVVIGNALRLRLIVPASKIRPFVPDKTVGRDSVVAQETARRAA